MAGPVDHEMVQGDTVALDFTVLDTSGQPVDLSGATIRWQMARSVRATPMLQKAIGSGVVVTSAAGGTFTVALDPDDTIALTGAFYFEVEIIDASGNVSTPRSGWLSITPGLIKPV